MSFDAIVIGAGVNGLVAAHLMAKAGQRVLVLERRTEPDRTPHQGWVPDVVATALGLGQRGLVISRPDPWISLALPDGGRLELWQDVAKSAESIRRLSPKDAARWPEFCARLQRIAQVLEALYTQPAPDVETTSPGELLRLGLVGVKVRRMGRQAMIDLLRVLPMSVSDLLGEWFESEPLKAALGAGGLLHLKQGPRSGGTAFNLLHHHAGSAPGVFRQAVSNIGEVLEAMPGVELRRDATVARITVKAGAATGVVLAGGDEIAAGVIVSGADPRATLLGLLEPGWLDPELALAVRNIKCRGVAARVNLTVNAAPGFERLTVAPSLEYLERAYDDAKYGRVSAHPWIEATAQGGRVDAHVQYVPWALAGGPWDDAGRRAFGDLVVDQLAAHAPALRQAVTAREVLTPRDLEDRSGLTEGHAYHGELTLDQILFMRPVAGWSRYWTPVRGLYLCGAGTHPGGGIAGASGWLAAREIGKGEGT